MSTSTTATTAATSAVPARFRSVVRTYGAPTFELIQKAKVLVVGAGGIGCELLKNLVLTGFMDITVLDLDTIDVSNLNRQFLFRRPHVGMSKAIVARSSVLAFQPTAKIEAIHGNIKEPKYDHDYFAQFSLVMNALDNVEARRHVNRLCLSSNRVLCESGTQGYAGQTTVIQGGKTECFECSPAPAAKTYAVCTIRNTPDKPVHCIVWAKALYSALFGPEEEGNIMADAKMDLGEGVKEAKAKFESIKAGSASPFELSSYSHFSKQVFIKLFQTEIEKQREVKDRWKDRAAPEVLDVDKLFTQLSQDFASNKTPFTSVSSSFYRSHDHHNCNASENALFFLHCIDEILSQRTEQLGELNFDKDDEASMDFVALASNLRMANFGIGTLSRFANKGIAGNIVHAIATTNAIAAGLMVNDAIKVLQGKLDSCHTMWITRRSPGLLTPQSLNPPNPKCFVCAKQILELTLDTDKWNLRKLFEQVLTKKLSMIEPSVDVVNRDNFIGTLDDHEEDNPDYLLLPLKSSGIRVDHGSLMSIDDQQQKLQVSIRIKHQNAEEWKEEEHPEGFILTGELSKAQTENEDEEEESKEEKKEDNSLAAKRAANKQKAAATTGPQSTEAVDVDNDLEMLEEAPVSKSSSTGTKRKHDADGENSEETTKKSKVEAQTVAADDDVIELD